MFDYSPAHWIAFLSAAALLNLSPGPDIAFILGHTVRSGIRSGFAALFGIWSGACVHVLMAAAGLSAILAASAIAFSTIKWVGAAYLIWLGIQALRSKGEGAWIKETGKTLPWSRIYRQGILVSLLNPKVAIFFSPSCRSSWSKAPARSGRSSCCTAVSSSWLPPSSSRRLSSSAAVLPRRCAAIEASACGWIAGLERC